MVVMILERVTPGMRGELTRWLLEPHPGTFVGYINAQVRDRLWERCLKSIKDGGMIQIWSTNNEQRFYIRTHGETRREIVDYEGLLLVRRK